MKKRRLFQILKVAGVAAGGAIVADPTTQQAIQSVVPAPYNVLVGSALAMAALFLKRPQDHAQETPKPQEPPAN